MKKLLSSFTVVAVLFVSISSHAKVTNLESITFQNSGEISCLQSVLIRGCKESISLKQGGIYSVEYQACGNNISGATLAVYYKDTKGHDLLLGSVTIHPLAKIITLATGGANITVGLNDGNSLTAKSHRTLGSSFTDEFGKDFKQMNVTFD